MSLKVYPSGRVYQIVNDVDDLKYVGSTGRTLAQRMSEHRRKSKKGTNGKKRSLYMHMRALGVEHFDIILIEQTGPTTKEALRAREQVHIVTFDTVNSGLNGRYESQVCEHNKQRAYCVDCEGSQICEHKKQRRICAECGGSQMCEHKRQRAACKDCGGSQICEHNKRRSKCKDCGGSEICEHNKMREKCKDCGGSQICEHNRERAACKDCGGSQICEHDKMRNQCKICNPCILCGVANIAKHRRSEKHLRNVAAQITTAELDAITTEPTIV